MGTQSSFQQMVNLLSNTLEAYTSAFFLKDSLGKNVSVVSFHTLSKYFKNQFSSSIGDSGLIERVIAKRETVKVDKLGQQFSIEEFPFYEKGEKGIKGLYAVPVGKVLGVLYVDTKRRWGFNDKQQKLVWEFAGILDTLVKSDRALEREKLYARMLRLWHNLEQQAEQCDRVKRYLQEVIHLAHKFVSAHSSYLFLIEREKGLASLVSHAGKVPEELTESKIRISNSVLKWVFSNKKTLKVRRMETKSKKQYLFHPHEPLPHSGSFLATPFLAQGEVAAIMGFLWEKEHNWNRDELYITKMIAKRSAMVFESFILKRRVAFLETIDPLTEFLRLQGFERVFQKKMNEAVENGNSMVLAIVQISPWLVVKANLSPLEERDIRQHISEVIVTTLGRNVTIGVSGDDRYCFLFMDCTLGETERKLTRLKTRLDHECLKAVSDLNLSIRSAFALFPADGTSTSDLWATLYTRLLSTKPKNSPL